MEDNQRSKQHARNPETENVLQELSSLLEGVGKERKFTTELPVIFIVGCARSGTTVLTQYLATTSDFCYPTNFISRFYFNPYLGALLQRLMFDLDTKGELFGGVERKHLDLFSNLGKTKGALSPNEFWYYWRRFFRFSEIQKLQDSDIKCVDRAGFVNGISAIQQVFQKPIFMKAMILNWNILLLHEMVPNSYFVFVERDLAHNAYSLLRARKEFYNDAEKWYSFKPVEYDEIKRKSPQHQVVDQVYFTNRAIREGLDSLPVGRHIKITYEEFCSNPRGFLLNLYQLLNLNNPSTMCASDFKILNTNSSNSYEQAEWEGINQYAKR